MKVVRAEIHCSLKERQRVEGLGGADLAAERQGAACGKCQISGAVERPGEAQVTSRCYVDIARSNQSSSSCQRNASACGDRNWALRTNAVDEIHVHWPRCDRNRAADINRRSLAAVGVGESAAASADGKIFDRHIR